jgi:5-methylcytosine-specific restriction endonuclease McrA
MARRRNRLILAIVATDATYAQRAVRGETLWVGRCIFCQGALSVTCEGDIVSRATVEHIRPRSHGGDDRLENLALACVGCNNEKGMRHDARPRGDARLAEIVERLSARRRERWRDPEVVGLAEVVASVSGSA